MSNEHGISEWTEIVEAGVAGWAWEAGLVNLMMPATSASSVLCGVQSTLAFWQNRLFGWSGSKWFGTFYILSLLMWSWAQWGGRLKLSFGFNLRVFWAVLEVVAVGIRFWISLDNVPCWENRVSWVHVQAKGDNILDGWQQEKICEWVNKTGWTRLGRTLSWMATWEGTGTPKWWLKAKPEKITNSLPADDGNISFKPLRSASKSVVQWI